MPGRSTKHPSNYDLATAFPNWRTVAGWEGGCCRAAEKDGKWYLIFDEGTMADFLDGDDPVDRKMLDQLITVVEYDTEAERQDSIRERFEPSPFPGSKLLRPRQKK